MNFPVSTDGTVELNWKERNLTINQVGQMLLSRFCKELKE